MPFKLGTPQSHHTSLAGQAPALAGEVDPHAARVERALSPSSGPNLGYDLRQALSTWTNKASDHWSARGPLGAPVFCGGASERAWPVVRTPSVCRSTGLPPDMLCDNWLDCSSRRWLGGHRLASPWATGSWLHTPQLSHGGEGRPSDPKMPSQLRSSGVWGARQQERLEKVGEPGEERATASADGQLASHNITL